MRKFLGQVAVVGTLTLVVSVILALTTGSTGPADGDLPAAAAESTSEDGNADTAPAGTSTVDADTGAAPTTPVEGTPDHLDDSGATNDDAEPTQVLGVTVAQESGSELADTGLAATPVLLGAAAMLILGLGVHHAGRRLAPGSVDT